MLIHSLNFDTCEQLWLERLRAFTESRFNFGHMGIARVHFLHRPKPEGELKIGGQFYVCLANELCG